MKQSDVCWLEHKDKLSVTKSERQKWRPKGLSKERSASEVCCSVKVKLIQHKCITDLHGEQRFVEATQSRCVIDVGIFNSGRCTKSQVLFSHDVQAPLMSFSKRTLKAQKPTIKRSKQNIQTEKANSWGSSQFGNRDFTYNKGCWIQNTIGSQEYSFVLWCRAQVLPQEQGTTTVSALHHSPC